MENVCMQPASKDAQISSEATFLYPTEVCYALGCDALNPQAVEKIFEIKPRQAQKSLLVLMKDIAMCQIYIDWNETLQMLAERYWPGPLTLVAAVRDTDLFPPGIVDEQGEVAFRISNHEIPTQIISKLNHPIVSTSADIKEQTNPHNLNAVLSAVKNQLAQPNYVFENGIIPERVPATIVRVDSAQQIHILRQGDIVVSFT